MSVFVSTNSKRQKCDALAELVGAVNREVGLRCFGFKAYTDAEKALAAAGPCEPHELEAIKQVHAVA